MGKNMGLGPLAEPTTVFPRQFRFTLESDLIKLEYYIVDVNVSYTSKTLDVKMIEFLSDEDCPVDEWLRSTSVDGAKTDLLTLTTYDGCGEALYKIEFTNVKLVEHNMPFNYEVSEPVTHKIKFSFGSSKRTFLIPRKETNEG